MSSSPPKPWEVSGENPPLPAKPDSAEAPSDYNSQAAGLGSSLGPSLGANPGLGGYGLGGLGGYNSLGGLGGYGGYNSLGGYGLGGYSGYGGYGGYGANTMNPNNPLASGTQAAFQLIESLIQAVGGFAQMLEATYMATQSSVFTVMSVGEQLGNIKNALGSVLGIYAVIRYAKKLLLKLTGLKVFAEKVTLNPKDFHEFNKRQDKVKISIKPLLIFLSAVFGVPYLLSKLVKTLAAQQQLSRKNLTVDPRNLEFCRAQYDFVPENPKFELQLTKGALYAVLSKKDPLGKESQWWKCRSRDGKVGYAPCNYLEVVKKSSHNLKED